MTEYLISASIDPDTHFPDIFPVVPPTLPLSIIFSISDHRSSLARFVLCPRLLLYHSLFSVIYCHLVIQSLIKAEPRFTESNKFTAAHSSHFLPVQEMAFAYFMPFSDVLIFAGRLFIYFKLRSDVAFSTASQVHHVTLCSVSV